MKAKPLLLAAPLLILFLSNCSKEKKDAVAQRTASEYFMPMKTGNYWVYKRTGQGGIYPNYTETVTYDSVKVKGDTVINGRTYFEIYGGLFLGVENGLYADSSGWIIRYGNGLFPLSVVANDTVAQGSLGNSLYVVYKTGSTDTSITVPAGTFPCTEMIWDAYYLLESPPASNPNPRPVFTYFSRNVGITKSQTWYYSGSGTTTMELHSYYIQP